MQSGIRSRARHLRQQSYGGRELSSFGKTGRWRACCESPSCIASKGAQRLGQARASSLRMGRLPRALYIGRSLRRQAARSFVPDDPSLICRRSGRSVRVGELHDRRVATSTRIASRSRTQPRRRCRSTSSAGVRLLRRLVRCRSRGRMIRRSGCSRGGRRCRRRRCRSRWRGWWGIGGRSRRSPMISTRSPTRTGSCVCRRWRVRRRRRIGCSRCWPRRSASGGRRRWSRSCSSRRGARRRTWPTGCGTSSSSSTARCSGTGRSCGTSGMGSAMASRRW